MAKKRNDGNDDDQVISFTPSAGFDIRKAAKDIKELMEDLGKPFVLQLAYLAVEFEPGCTRKEIIDGYHYALEQQQLKAKPSNANARVTEEA